MASYDEAKLTTTLRGTFATFNPSTGANKDADSLPTGLVYKLSDGTTLGATVTIANITTGRYRYSVDVTTGNGFAAGEYYELWASATVTGDTTVTQSTPLCGFKATTSDIDTVDDFLDTEVAAIKAKTDNLPSDPADQSAVEAAITAATSGLATAANLATVAGYLDTEIAAILADTNELQTDWVNGGRLDLILDARASQSSVDDVPTVAEFEARTIVSANYATAANLLIVSDGVGFVTAVLMGSCADAGTAGETYVITFGGATYTADYTGLDATGNRTATTRTKS